MISLKKGKNCVSSAYSLKLSFVQFISISFAFLTLSCAGPRFISEAKWKDKHIVYFKTNQEDVTVKNKKGEKLEQASDGKILAVYIDKLRAKNLKLTLSHPSRADTTIKIKRSVRAGALIFDCTFGAILYGIPLIVDFANVNIYQVKKSSRNLTVNMLYNDQYYERKLYEAKQKGNIAAFEEFIKNYPESKFVIEAQNSIYSLAWNDANKKNTIPAYDDFIAKYPKATQVTEAQNKVYDIAYNAAVFANTPEAFENYINKYPKSPKVDEAKIKQKTVKEIDNAYNTSLKTNTYAGFSVFLNTYKNTKYNTEIASKMASAFYRENSNKLKTLDGVNSTITLIKEIEFDYSIRCEELNKLNITRDEHLAEKLKTVTNKNQFFAILKEQAKVETGDAKEDNAYAIADRVFSNSKINLNGQYSRWRSDGTKELVVYLNNKLNGTYTKYAADEKTILEKGMYNNGIRTGLYVVNYPSGKKHYEQTWSNSSIESEIEYDEQGKNLTALKEQETKKAEAEEKRKEEEKKPKLGINYWISNDTHECECCYKQYKRKVYKCNSYEIALALNNIEFMEWNMKTLEKNALDLIFMSAEKPFYFYTPAKENCGRKGCIVRCGY